MGAIRAILKAVSARIERAARAAGRDPGAVRLLAVAKTHPAALVDEAYQAGQLAFGENYVQEALGKMDALACLPLEWHLIGPLHSNNSERIARRLSAQRPVALPPLNVLVQVNVSGEPSKSGVAPQQLPELAHAVAAW